jgi:hypothetical protein
MFSSSSYSKLIILVLTLIVTTNANENSLICQQKDIECDKLIATYLLQFQTIEEIDNEIINLHLIKNKVEKIMNDKNISTRNYINRLKNYNFLKAKLDVLLSSYDNVVTKINNKNMVLNQLIEGTPDYYENRQKILLELLDLVDKKIMVINNIRKIQKNNDFENYIDFIMEEYNTKIDNKTDALKNADINAMTRELIEYNQGKIKELENILQNNYNLETIKYKLMALEEKKHTLQMLSI